MKQIMIIAQAVDPTGGAIETLTSSGVLGALVVVLMYASYKLLRLLLEAKDEIGTAKIEALEKQYEIQTATKEVLDKVIQELRRVNK